MRLLVRKEDIYTLMTEVHANTQSKTVSKTLQTIFDEFKNEFGIEVDD